MIGPPGATRRGEAASMGVELGLHFSCSSGTGDGWPEIYRAAVRQAELADRLGFGYGLVAEHHFTANGWIPAPMLLCAAIAQATTRLRVGPNVMVLPFQHPIHIAEQIAVLDNLSDGRAMLVAGMGQLEPEFVAHEIPYKQRVSRTEEAMEIIGRLLAEERVSHEGKRFAFPEITVTPRPQQKPRPGLWYGTISEPGARRAARLADGMMIPPNVSLGEARAIASTYRALVAELSGGEREGRVILRRDGHIAADSETAWRRGAPALHNQYANVYHVLDPVYDEAKLREYAADRLVIGGPEEALHDVQRFAEATGAEAVVFRLQVPGLEDEEVQDGIRVLAEHVLDEVG
jgi:alkanesulfonate monooxygenase SsuD/methylene tetrahydromethanopterin reductase-like flavin-dependent oxidoreductase (luciferase family)